MDEKRFIVVGDSRSEPRHTLAKAREIAAENCKENGPRSIYGLVDTVRALPVQVAWDGETQPVAAEPAYKVGDSVIVEGALDDDEERSGSIFQQSKTPDCHIVMLTSGPHKGVLIQRNDKYIRRSIAAPAAKPSFEFGERVRVGQDVNNSSFAAGFGVFAGVEPTGNYTVLIEKIRDTVYFKPDQVFKL